jgi:hypothetical protein
MLKQLSGLKEYSMDNTQILAILEAQPDEAWTYGILADDEGRYCALGWIYKTAIDNNFGYQVYPAHNAYGPLDELLGEDLSFTIQSLNDDARTHTQALELLRELLS